MRVVDPCGWVEHSAGGRLAAAFEPYLVDSDQAVTSTVVLCEVYRSVRRGGTDEEAMVVVRQFEETTVVPLVTVDADPAA